MRKLETDLTTRLDSLPWSGFHTRFLVALGVTWVLDAFEVVIVGNVLAIMKEHLKLSPVQGSLLVSGFLIGAIIGSFLFGYLADLYGRKRIFLITLVTYSLGTFLTGFAWDFYSAFVLRIVAGAGIGGEFAAIHSAIDEFVPSRHRGKVDGLVVASWNVGSILASLTALFLLKHLPPDLAWRVAFFLGGFIALLVVYVRRHVPESPRWLLSKGMREEAERIVRDLEREAGVVRAGGTAEVPVFEGNLLEGIGILLGRYRWRLLFATSVSITILTTYYGMVTLIPVSLAPSLGIEDERIPFVFLLGSAGGLVGGVVVAFLADAIGRKATGLGVLILSVLSTLALIHTSDFYPAFVLYSLTAFSFACVGYVTAMEIFPSYIRATAIGLISIAGRIGGTVAPPFVISLAETDYRMGLYGILGFWVFGLVIFGLWSLFGIEARGRSIEEIT
jgi:MFS family permease